MEFERNRSIRKDCEAREAEQQQQAELAQFMRFQRFLATQAEVGQTPNIIGHTIENCPILAQHQSRLTAPSET